MALQIFDSKSQSLRQFAPLEAGKVGIYVCGPTVQSAPHVGHLRNAVAFDLIKNWLTLGHSLDVTFVRNVTDIDDKILANAKDQSRDWRELAESVNGQFDAAYAALGIATTAPETQTPKATEYISQMIELIELLIQRGHAYVATDGSANVFFDTNSWPSYGELTNQKIENLEGEQDGSHGRKSPTDFALFKAHKPEEPETASWLSPWGRGRPGWHIECSAMTHALLGESFDIHGGGLDLRFPHHENELAQSRAAGFEFANFWMHNGLVTIAGQKMSKSLGNGISADSLLASASASAVRYWLGSAHYRSTLDYSTTALAEAESALGRIKNFVRRATDVQTANGQTSDGVSGDRGTAEQTYPSAFIEAMDADFNVPAALAAMHDAVRAGNAALDAGDAAAAASAAAQVTAMAQVLGFDLTENAAADAANRADDATIAKIDALVIARRQARADKDFALADSIRVELTELGVVLEDQADKTTWMWSN
jgi:cysteinyl-tRNA synthetase